MGLYVDIEKDYGSFHLSVQLEAGGGITGLLGASGSGKSLTLKAIAGIERPTQGIIRLDGETLFDSGKNLHLPPQRRQVGYLFQSYALFPHMTVEENILCSLHRVKDRGERRRELGELCDLLQLRGLEGLRPGQLSGGQAQRVALARILAAKPRLLLLDEPFSALDSHLRDQLQPQLQGLLQDLGLQTLLVTHSRDEAYGMCAHLHLMDEGKVVRSGATRAVFAQPGTVAAARLTGCKNIAPARRMGEFQVEVPDWGLTLTTAHPVPEDLTAIGVRAHGFSTGGVENSVPIRTVRTLEEPFEWSHLFRFQNQREGTADLWWRTPKHGGDGPVDRLTIPPEEILLLTEGGPFLC